MKALEVVAVAVIAGALAYWALFGIEQQRPHELPLGLRVGTTLAWQWEGCWWSETAPPWSQKDEDWICAA